ncbi:MAG: hypothetical protein M0R70_11455 [Nitrospirae bacterium]|nr:hypothetical protein [Nitrospirota bacterium]
MKILTTLLDIATSFLHVLEAEGRLLKRAVMNVAWALAFIGIASVLVLAATGFFLAGIYQYLAANLSPAAASIFVSFPALVFAVIFAGIVKWWTDDPK